MNTKCIQREVFPTFLAATLIKMMWLLYSEQNIRQVLCLPPAKQVSKLIIMPPSKRQGNIFSNLYAPVVCSRCMAFHFL